jgi:hypothetical protein
LFDRRLPIMAAPIRTGSFIIAITGERAQR